MGDWSEASEPGSPRSIGSPVRDVDLLAAALQREEEHHASSLSNNALEELIDQHGWSAAAEPPRSRPSVVHRSASTSHILRGQARMFGSPSLSRRPSSKPRPEGRSGQQRRQWSSNSIYASSGPAVSPSGRSGVRPSAGGDSQALQLQVPKLAGRLFSESKEQELEELVLSEPPRPGEESVEAAFRRVQDGLDFAMRSRRKFVRSAEEIEQSLVAEIQTLLSMDQSLAQTVESCTAEVQEKDKDLVRRRVEAAEEKHRRETEAERREEELADLRHQLADAAENRRRVIFENLSLERRVAELSALVASANSPSAEEARLEGLARLQEELGELRRSLEAKSNELSSLTDAFARAQRAAERREEELRAQLLAWEQGVGVDPPNATAAAAAAEADKEAEQQRRQVELAAARAEIAVLRERANEKDAAAASAAATLETLQGLQGELRAAERLRERAEQREAEERQERVAATAQLAAVQEQRHEALLEAQAEFQRREAELSAELGALKEAKALVDGHAAQRGQRVQELETEVAELAKGLEQIQEQDQAAKMAALSRVAGEAEGLRQRLAEAEAEVTRLKQALATKDQAREDELERLKEQIRQGDAQRRRMHNTIQELRGNVRVIARVRPFLPGETVPSGNARSAPVESPHQESAIVVAGDASSVAVCQTLDGGRCEPLHHFGFDRAFHPSQGQDVVFEEVSEFVQSALDGYIVCLFSYGQTGSGKTHTMQGSGSGAMRGIIPRALEQVAAYSEHLATQGWTFSMHVSFVEVYCEKIRDLLRELAPPEAPISPSSRSAGEYRVQQTDYGAHFVTNAQMIPVDPGDRGMMEDLLAIAARARATKKTDMNDTSSRSHSVFTLHLRATNERLGAALQGQLNLCDLAGSERVDKSNVKGVALTEAKNINRSLSALSHVFDSLAKKTSHVPYRDSTLTHLLEPALSSTGKTLMIINLSPVPDSIPESISTLRFGARVSQVELGRPERQLGSMASGDLSFAQSSEMTARPLPSRGGRRSSGQGRGRGRGTLGRGSGTERHPTSL